MTWQTPFQTWRHPVMLCRPKLKPKKRKSIKIEPNQLETWFEELFNDIVNASIHWNFYQDLRKSTDEYNDIMNVSRGFWGFTISSHYQAAIAYLFRAYDDHRDGLNLLRFINNMSDHCDISPKEINADRHSVSNADLLVRKLRWTRNNLFAHKSVAVIFGKGNQRQVMQLSGITEHQTLIDRAAKVVNRYNGNIRNRWQGIDLHGGDDFKYVLSAVKRDWERMKRRHQGEEVSD